MRDLEDFALVVRHGAERHASVAIGDPLPQFDEET
jgi:hypothetical protein